MTLISNQDWKSAQSGQVVVLTEEERRTLIAEGYPIPQRFPLSKAEERSLKKIRRKIKNKISAQESRRKKKEYMEELEKKVQLMELKIVELERENRLIKEQCAGGTKSNNNLCRQASPQSSLVTNYRQNSAALASETPTGVGKQFAIVSIVGADGDSPEQKSPFQDNGNDLAQEAGLNNEPQTISTSTSGALHDNNSVQVQRKNSTQSNLSATDDDHFIDDILMSQERQEGQQGGCSDSEVDLVANLVGVVCESDDIQQICHNVSQQQQAEERPTDHADDNHPPIGASRRDADNLTPAVHIKTEPLVDGHAQVGAATPS